MLHAPIAVADLGGGARGAIAPPFLKSQEVQKNECIDIRTQQINKILAFSVIFALYKIQQSIPFLGLHPPHPLLHIYTN